MTSSKPEIPDIRKLFENVPEHPEGFQAEVEGKIPEWLNGILLRNGPGIFEIGPDKYDHWFDGLAIIQRYLIHDGKVEYSTKYLHSDTYKRNVRARRIVVSEFGTIGHPDPCKNIFERYFCHFFPSELTDNDLVAFVQCGDEIYASSETGRLNRLDPNTLDVIDKVNMHDYLAINTATAHPHYDKDGNTYNMGSSLRSYNIIFVPKPDCGTETTTKVNPFEKSKIVASIQPQSWYLSYYHSFGMSENFIIFPEMPLLMNPWKMICAEFSLMQFSTGVEWWPKTPAKLHIVNSKTGDSVPLEYTADAFFVFHHINAYEEKGCIVMDSVAYLDGSIVHDFDLNELRKGIFPAADEKKRGCFRRFVLPLTIPDDSKPGENLLEKFDIRTGATACLTENGKIHCEFETLFHQGCELPRINYDYNGSMYNYCYAAATPQDRKDFLGSKILKFDIENRKILEWNRDHIYQFASEPVFVGKPEAKEEDDGVLLVPVTNIKPEEDNFLLILDAKTLNELARAWVRPEIPVGFHGSYLPSAN